MTRYEYKVVPAPTRGTKAKGVRSPEGRFAVSIEATLNEMGAQGWEYLRAELLPSDERVGLTGSTTNWRNVLVFRRAVAGAATARPQAASQVAETGLPPIGGAERPAPAIIAAAASAPPVRAEPLAGDAAARPTPPLIASRQPTVPADEADESEAESGANSSGIEKVMRFTARRGGDRPSDKTE